MGRTLTLEGASVLPNNPEEAITAEEKEMDLVIMDQDSRLEQLISSIPWHTVRKEEVDLLPLINAEVVHEQEPRLLAQLYEPDYPAEQLEKEQSSLPLVTEETPAGPPVYQTFRDIAESGIDTVGQSMEGVFGQIDSK